MNFSICVFVVVLSELMGRGGSACFFVSLGMIMLRFGVLKFLGFLKRFVTS